MRFFTFPPQDNSAATASTADTVTTNNLRAAWYMVPPPPDSAAVRAIASEAAKNPAALGPAVTSVPKDTPETKPADPQPVRGGCCLVM